MAASCRSVLTQVINEYGKYGTIGEGKSSNRGIFWIFFYLLYSTLLHLPIYHYMTLCLWKLEGGGIDQPPFKIVKYRDDLSCISLSISFQVIKNGCLFIPLQQLCTGWLISLQQLYTVQATWLTSRQQLCGLVHFISAAGSLCSAVAV